MRTLQWIVLFIFLMLGGRIAYIQLFDSRYKELARTNVMRREVHPMALSCVTLDTPALTEGIGDMAALAVAMYTLERN